MRTLPLLLLVSTACEPTDTDGVDRGTLRLGFPLPERDLFSEIVGVDHDPEDHSDSVLGGAICTNYQGEGFPFCYDGHGGTDYLLDGGFDTMDAGSAEIVAAAAGLVIETRDGEYDRCHVGDDFEVTCDGHPIRANYVIVEHFDGSRTLYWHMMSGSVLVQVGQAVHCGEPLGRVGSSGISSTPHLHFQLDPAEGPRIDPYAGPESQPETWWDTQEAGDGLPGPGCTL